MGGICDNVRREVYPEVEIDYDLGIRLGPGLIKTIPVAVTSMVMVGVDDAGPGFTVGAAYVKVIGWRSR